MSTSFTEISDLPAVEERLSDSTPFGSYECITRNLMAVYADLLAVIAKQSRAAANLLHLLDQVGEGRRQVVLRDSALRRTIEDGACRIAGGVNSIEATTLEELLSAAAESTVSEKLTVVNGAASCVPFGNQTLGHAHIWLDDQPRTLPGRRLTHEVVKRLPGLDRAVAHSPVQLRLDLSVDRLRQRTRLDACKPRLALGRCLRASLNRPAICTSTRGVGSHRPRRRPDRAASASSTLSTIASAERLTEEGCSMPALPYRRASRR